MIQLFRLSFRRALPRGYALALAAVLVLAATRDFGPSADVLAALGGDAAARAAARAGVLFLAALAVVPALVGRAGAALARFRRADAEWLATRAASPLACLAVTWAGVACAGAALLCAFFAAGELAAGGSAPCLRHVRTLAHEPLKLVSGALAEEVALHGSSAAELAGGAVLRARLVPLPGRGPSADVRLEARAGGRALGFAAARIFDRRPIDVVLERTGDVVLERAGAGELTLALERAESGAYVLLPRDGVELLRTGATERAASATVALHLLCLLAASSALALGLGAWMRGSLAAVLAFALWLPCWSHGLGRGLVPGADVFRQLELLGDGVAPAPPGPALLAVTLLISALGLALARLGWRAGGAA